MLELVGMNLWQYLLVLAVASALTIKLVLKPKRVKPALLLGLFLALLDFAVQNLAAYKNLWYSSGSLLFLGAVPVEVFLIAILAGFTYRIVFSRGFDLKFAFASSLLIATVAVGLEAFLINEKLLYYANWNSWLALTAYFAVFMALNYLNTRVE